jgi:mono/diheme cytochrome c family protein
LKALGFFLPALLLSIAAGGSLKAQNAAAAAAGDAGRGKTLFVKYNCYSCHGYDGHGGGAGVKLAPKPISMAAFLAFVRRPAASSMPTFSAKVVPDAELRDIWAYLNSIPAAPAAKDIPLLNQ